MKSIKEKIMQIEMLEKENKRIEGKADELDRERLEKVIEIAKKGLKYEKIYEERVCTRYKSYNEYFTDSDNKYLKGICIYSDTIEDSFYPDWEYFENKEMWLMKDGSIEIYKQIGHIERNINIDDKITRELMENQNINQFDIDEVIESINALLSDRLEELGDRCKKQKKRLEKLEKLKLN
ncbi:hypothetical protein [Clostridium butyricum]|uniref:hypothetical protein n=1 Tax=Clostridium butyricum TaxID=1492 RepID=UPI002AAFC6FB|nr:hypothetical protein [Clostridium butyricum]